MLLDLRFLWEQEAVIIVIPPPPPEPLIHGVLPSREIGFVLQFRESEFVLSEKESGEQHVQFG